MLYYEYKVIVKKEESEDVKGESEYEKRREIALDINNKTEVANTKLPYNVRFYVSSIHGCEIQLFGFIGYKNNEDPAIYAKEFVKMLGYKPLRATGGEITIKSLTFMAKSSERSGFIHDDRMLLDQAHLWGINPGRAFTETIVENDFTKEKALEKEKENFLGQSILEEIERIYEPSVQKTYVGNPVHYIVYTDDLETANQISNLLVASLYANKRLKTTRLATIKPEKCGGPFDDDEEIDMDTLETLYTIQKGGALVVEPNGFAKEGNFADSSDILIEDLAKLIEDNKTETLSIIVLNKADKKIAEELKMHLPKIRFVELEEENCFRSNAIEILKKKATDARFEHYDSLLSKIPEDERSYSKADLNKIYNDWLDVHLVENLYPQYKNIKLPDIRLAETKGSAYTQLQSLIGLEKAKEVIQQALDFNKAKMLYKKAGLPEMNPARHMVFSGNPGTAKTTVARLLARILKDNGVLSRGNLIEVGRNDLVGKYVGWTAKLVEEAFMKARGSVLFIDEAYSLCEERGGLYGDEAINTIVQMMENQRDDTLVIFAGYPDKMEEFLSKNPGLRSRIAYHVNFDDYSTDQLVKIFELMAKENHINLADGVTDYITPLFDKARNKLDFGNGRYVRNIFEQARMKQSSRLVSLEPASLTDDVITTLTVDDFLTVSAPQTKQESHTIGFAC